MDLFSAMNISASGLAAQRDRMNVISSNLANMHTTRTAGGGPYRRKSVVFETQAAPSFQEVLQDRIGQHAKGVRVSGVAESGKPPVRVFDPSHPDAGADGYVLLPAIDLMSEMVDMISASRAFEANTAAVGASKNMANKALEIGR